MTIEKIFKKYATEHNGTSLAEDGIMPFITISSLQMAYIFMELEKREREIVERTKKARKTPSVSTSPSTSTRTSVKGVK